MLAVLSGGTGTPKLLTGLKEVADFSVVVNTAEDIWVSGNKVCPDIDSVIYALAEIIDEDKWWGVKNDSFVTHNFLKKLGFDEMLMIGDIDRATHIFRSELLRKGYSLTEATLKLAEAYGVKNKVLPMCEEEVETRIVCDAGDLHFQEFWIKHRGEPEVYDVYFKGIEKAEATEEVLGELERSKAVIIGPSNPITSISPILMVKGVREVLEEKIVVAVSPIIGSSPVSGPAAKFMRAKGYEVSPAGVYEVYKDFLDALVVQTGDEWVRSEVDCEVFSTDTIMKSKEDAVKLSKFLLEIVEKL
ncbi:LPPG domain protein containing protein [Ferroglobus placidus DSM 10642]|uniref:2-phospho-L-lactate transferase n=1 Tax=Ferroglobus placidus (strain DSM 10642 / AEDII12DO) TaxID=589924 RepID=D3RXB1_FERPA|nr:2-phospho-L-lactate transferase [Ferroglobus placidus]ADC65124.1 LPPG domain protein containing protein [Ferroglobus placidus DSM 10642]